MAIPGRRLIGRRLNAFALARKGVTMSVYRSVILCPPPHIYNPIPYMFQHSQIYCRGAANGRGCNGAFGAETCQAYGYELLCSAADRTGKMRCAQRPLGLLPDPGPDLHFKFVAWKRWSTKVQCAVARDLDLNRQICQSVRHHALRLGLWLAAGSHHHPVPVK